MHEFGNLKNLNMLKVFSDVIQESDLIKDEISPEQRTNICSPDCSHLYFLHLFPKLINRKQVMQKPTGYFYGKVFQALERT
jgi:hypothetical protein